MADRVAGNQDSDPIRAQQVSRDPSVRIARRNNGSTRNVMPPSGQQRMGSGKIPEQLVAQPSNMENMRQQMTEGINKGTPVEVMPPPQQQMGVAPTSQEQRPSPLLGKTSIEDYPPKTQALIQGLILRNIVRGMSQ